MIVRALLVGAMVVLAGILVVALDYDNIYEEFVEIRSEESLGRMETFIDLLSEMEEVYSDPKLLTLLADAHREYANWAPDDKKRDHYERARSLAEEAIELDADYGYAHYVAGASIGQLAQFAGIIRSIFMLGDFDRYIEKAMELIPDNHFPFLAMGMRYRDTPWPYRDHKKSEELILKAIEMNPEYLNSYIELAELYIKTKDDDKAADAYFKVLELKIQSEWRAQGEEAKREAEEWLRDNGYLN